MWALQKRMNRLDAVWDAESRGSRKPWGCRCSHGKGTFRGTYCQLLNIGFWVLGKRVSCAKTVEPILTTRYYTQVGALGIAIRLLPIYRVESQNLHFWAWIGIPLWTLAQFRPKARGLGTEVPMQRGQGAEHQAVGSRNCRKFVTMSFNLHADMQVTVLSVDLCDFYEMKNYELFV